MAAAASSSRRKYWIFGVLFTLSLAADQLTKIWARQTLKPRHDSIVVINGFFDLVYSENPGAAFGLFRGIPGARWFLLAVGVGAMVVIFSLLRRSKGEGFRLPAELGLLAGGAVGNIVERVSTGLVTDFVLWHYHDLQWPVFNIADAALVVGVIGLLFDLRSVEESSSKGEGDGKAAVTSRAGRSRGPA